MSHEPNRKELFKPYFINSEIIKDCQKVDIFYSLKKMVDKRVGCKGLHYHYNRLIKILMGEPPIGGT